MFADALGDTPFDGIPNILKPLIVGTTHTVTAFDKAEAETYRESHIRTLGLQRMHLTESFRAAAEIAGRRKSGPG